MNSLPTVFAVPSASLNLLHKQPNPDRKRKRNGQVPPKKPQSQMYDELESHNERNDPVEYSAVVTPAERSQRRLAGLPLNQDPPTFPFPHAAVSPKASQADFVTDLDKDIGIPNQRSRGRTSLHAQHLAAMTAVLHRCMAARDYTRAGRALGLILRSEVGGHPVDIRSEGLWGMGAEILFRQRELGLTENDSQTTPYTSITREGFERAKSYYEHLIVQYPQHRTWPDAINALDFGIAMFGLWIYVTDQESLRFRRDLRDEGGNASVEQNGLDTLEAKQWELEQAQQIAEAMDLRMSNVSFSGSRDFVRLRAMVSLWLADLIEACAEFEASDEEQDEAQEMSNQVERPVVDQPQLIQPRSDLSDAIRNRKMAKMLFEKLKSKGEQTDLQS